MQLFTNVKYATCESLKVWKNYIEKATSIFGHNGTLLKSVYLDGKKKQTSKLYQWGDVTRVSQKYSKNMSSTRIW